MPNPDLCRLLLESPRNSNSTSPEKREREREGERESGWKAVVRGEDWLSICEPQCEAGPVFTNQCGDLGLRRGGGGLTHH